MRALYREQRHECNEYLDIDVFPIFKQSTSGKRKKKAKPTSLTQEKYNHQCRVKKLERLVMANFRPGEAIFYNPSYNNAYLPSDDAVALRSRQNFFKRLKRYRKKKGLPELKYIVVTEKGKRSGRYHHHMILNCADMTTAELDKIWGMGFAYSSLVIFDNEGVCGLADYFCKKKKPNAENEEEPDDKNLGNAWSASRNVVQPKETKRDGRISKSKAYELYTLGNDAKAEWEKLYPGYSFSSAKALYNEVNGGFYIAARMRRKPAAKKKPKPKGGSKAK